MLCYYAKYLLSLFSSSTPVCLILLTVCVCVSPERLLFHGTANYFLWFNAAQTWSLPLTSICYRGYKRVETEPFSSRAFMACTGKLSYFLQGNFAEEISFEYRPRDQLFWNRISIMIFSLVCGLKGRTLAQNRYHPLLSTLCTWHSHTDVQIYKLDSLSNDVK